MPTDHDRASGQSPDERDAVAEPLEAETWLQKPEVIELLRRFEDAESEAAALRSARCALVESNKSNSQGSRAVTEVM